MRYIIFHNLRASFGYAALNSCKLLLIPKSVLTFFSFVKKVCSYFVVCTMQCYVWWTSEGKLIYTLFLMGPRIPGGSCSLSDQDMPPLSDLFMAPLQLNKLCPELDHNMYCHNFVSFSVPQLIFGSFSTSYWKIWGNKTEFLLLGVFTNLVEEKQLTRG